MVEPPVVTETASTPEEQSAEPPAAPPAAQTAIAAPRIRSTEEGCKALAVPTIRLWDSPAPVAIARVGEVFVAAGYSWTEGTHRIFAVRFAPGGQPNILFKAAVRPGAKRPRSVAPGLAALGGDRFVLAMVDGKSNVWSAELGFRSLGADWQRVGQHADARFAPAIAPARAGTAIAWTQRRTTGMRVKITVLPRAGPARIVDATPAAMGGTAATVVAGAAPAIVFADARAGLSPVVYVGLSATAAPEVRRILRPVGTIFEPPVLAAAQAEDALYVAYTALGNAATTAVGLFRAGDEHGGPVQPLVAGTGYGPLHVAATSNGSAALFAASAPRAPNRNAPREIQVRVVRPGGMGSPTVVQGPEGTAVHPAIATAKDGTTALAFATGSGVFVTWLTCPSRI